MALILGVAACESGKPDVAGEPGGGSSAGSGSPPASGSSGSGGSGSTPSGGSPINFASSGDDAFDAWRKTFAAKATSQGKQRATVISVLSGLTPLEQQATVATFDQPEFSKPMWTYVGDRTKPATITRGQTKMADNKAAFDQIEADYAPPREIVAAIWSMESSFGSYIGDIDAPRALATQAAQGRRVAFNEGELIAIMQIIEAGEATREQFKKASWAGAVGQTQFMPSTLIQNARDFDKDGKWDVWTNSGDALLTAANYITRSGWKKNQPYIVEVKVPDGFDYSLGDGTQRTVAEWKARGLANAGAVTLGEESLQAELFLPAGSYGPAFLLYPNFKVIKTYNNADSYALAVSLLADKLAGRPDLSRPWPTNIVMPSLDQIKELQLGLAKLGYTVVGTADGIIGRNTRKALMSFQKDRNLTADGFPTTEMVEKVLAAAA